jgi:MFS transporter, DHA3 family, macrolide efflux protein
MKALLATQGGRTFLTMWLGQSVSSFGSRLTIFAFGIWLYRETGLATPLYLTALAGFLPGVLLAPLAGVLVDRFDRRHVMLWVNTVHTLVTLAQFVAISSGLISLPLILVLLAISSCAETFQFPAESSSISVLVPKEQLGQANGLYSVSGGIGDLLAPLAGAFLLSSIGISGILLMDLASFVFEFVTLFLIRIPKPSTSSLGAAMSGGVLAQAREGFRFITARPGLLSLLITFTGVNFILGLVQQLQVPLVLSRSTDPNAVGFVASSFGVGVLLGGVYMTTTGGVRPRVHGVFAGNGLVGIFGTMLFGLSQTVPVWMLANFCAGFLLPVLNGSSQSIWQQKTPTDIQGRVFTARRQIAQITSPLAFLIAGPLTDLVFKPLFSSPAANSWAWILGGSNGRGYAAMFVLFGAILAVWSFSGYLRPAARNVERDVADA